MIQLSDRLHAGIRECRLILKSAEQSRRTISSNAELTHGECDFQLSVEQNLTQFVKSIDYALEFYDEIDRLLLNFRSPLFPVLDPDLSDNLTKIENGIIFFDEQPFFGLKALFAEVSKPSKLRCRFDQNEYCHLSPTRHSAPSLPLLKYAKRTSTFNSLDLPLRLKGRSRCQKEHRCFQRFLQYKSLRESIFSNLSYHNLFKVFI